MVPIKLFPLTLFATHWSGHIYFHVLSRANRWNTSRDQNWITGSLKRCRCYINPKSSILNLSSLILNPQSSIFNPQSSIFIPQPSTLNSHHYRRQVSVNSYIVRDLTPHITYTYQVIFLLSNFWWFYMRDKKAMPLTIRDCALGCTKQKKL